MSPLWEFVSETKKYIKKKGPSQQHIHSILYRESDNPSDISDKLSYSSSDQSTIKGTSLFSSHGGMSAGMTVEAGIALPLFLFFFFQLGNAIECIRFHCNMELALWDVGREIALYSSVLQEQRTEQLLQEIGEELFTNTYVKERVIHFGDTNLFRETPIVGQEAGITFGGSDIVSEDDMIHLTMIYQVNPMGVLPGFYMSNEYYCHSWNGYEIPREAEEGVVFVTEYGEVFHESRDCVHLRIEIEETTADSVKKLRNAGGAKYKACARCTAGKKSSRLYITEDGNRYHSDRDCPGLKRTVYTVLRGYANQHRGCHRCAGGR